jgi:hypothetical protein
MSFVRGVMCPTDLRLNIKKKNTERVGFTDLVADIL